MLSNTHLVENRLDVSRDTWDGIWNTSATLDTPVAFIWCPERDLVHWVCLIIILAGLKRTVQTEPTFATDLACKVKRLEHFNRTWVQTICLTSEDLMRTLVHDSGLDTVFGESSKPISCNDTGRTSSLFTSQIRRLHNRGKHLR